MAKIEQMYGMRSLSLTKCTVSHEGPINSNRGHRAMTNIKRKKLAEKNQFFFALGMFAVDFADFETEGRQTRDGEITHSLPA
jgi:hypothetical protein